MKKNIFITLLGVLLIASVFLNVSYNSKISQLENIINEKDQSIESLKLKFDEAESNYNKMKKIAEQWSARAFNSGYKDSKATKIGK